MDPYRTFHGLTEDYRDPQHPDGDPFPPIFPWRVRAFIYGMALQAEEEEFKRTKAMAGAK